MFVLYGEWRPSRAPSQLMRYSQMFSVFLSIKTVVWLIVYFYLFLTPLNDIPQRLFTNNPLLHLTTMSLVFTVTPRSSSTAGKSDPRDKVSPIRHPVAC